MKKYPFVLFAVALIAAVPLHAEASAPSQAAAQEETFDLRFPGGSVGDLIDVIAQVSGYRPNVIAAPEVREINLPLFELFSVTRDQMLKAFERVLVGLPDKQVRLSREDGFWIIDVRSVPQPGSLVPQPPSVTRIFHIGSLLSDLQLEDVTTAIETAWEMEGVEEGHNLRFHEETKLLFVRGSFLQISLVEQVLNELMPRELSAEEKAAKVAAEANQRRAQRAASAESSQTGTK